MQKIAVIGNSCVDFINLRAPLLKYLQNCDAEVTVIGPVCDENEILDEMKKLKFNYVPYNIKPVSLNPFDDMLSFFQMMRALKSISPDKVLLFTLKPIVYGSVAARLKGIRNVFSLNSGLGRIFVGESNYHRFVLFFLKPLLKIAFKFNEKVFFQNPDDSELFHKLGLCDKNKSIVVNGTGIDLKAFPLKTIPRNEKLKFIMISRIIEEKGIHFFYEAAKKIKKDYPCTEFQLLGNFCDSQSGISENTILNWHKEGIINYLGETDDVRPFLEKADVFVLPTYYREGVPRTCMEALATGLPIITTDVPGCRETVINEKNGILIQPKNITALEEAIKRFIKAPYIIDSMIMNGRSLVEKKFDINKVNSDIAYGMGLSSK
tara:strand:+ start:33141 stop:34271 length:1131 start_codon:yes stop_codon:yes gene_type:complete